MSEVGSEKKKKPWFRRTRKPLALAAIGITGLFFGNKLLLNNSAEHSKFWPGQQPPVKTDSEYKVGTWNVHKEDKTRAIGRLFARESFDVLMLQEITKRDAGKINIRYPQLYSTFALADPLNQPHRGGTGNAIVTELKPDDDVRTIELEGSSNEETLTGTINGAREDLDNLDFSLTQTKNGRQEPRSAMALTVPLDPEPGAEEVNLITGHIAYDRQVHDSQREEFFKFVKDESSGDDPAVVCADFNPRERGEVPQAFSLLRGFITVETEPTTESRDYPIDVCAYSEAGVLGYHADSGVMSGYGSDHDIAYAAWNVEGE